MPCSESAKELRLLKRQKTTRPSTPSTIEDSWHTSKPFSPTELKKLGFYGYAGLQDPGSLDTAELSLPLPIGRTSPSGGTATTMKGTSSSMTIDPARSCLCATCSYYWIDTPCVWRAKEDISSSILNEFS